MNKPGNNNNYNKWIQNYSHTEQSHKHITAHICYTSTYKQIHYEHKQTLAIVLNKLWVCLSSAYFKMQNS